MAPWLRKKKDSPVLDFGSPLTSRGGTSIVPVSQLREELSTVAWVQCDNMHCLKWRKVPKEVADKLEDQVWKCNMNENPDFQSCDVPEEDTALFDRLAKQANLDLIKSEIKLGSVVWAKMDGYCRWPALITVDPPCGDHADGDKEEILWYHVEFLGAERSHGWVQAKRVDVFGPGNSHELDNCEKTSVKSKSGPKHCKRKGKAKLTTGKSQKLRRTYKGTSTVQKAISEALGLLALPADERLKGCWFVKDESSAPSQQPSCSGCWGKKKFSQSKKSRPSQEQSMDVYGESKDPKVTQRQEKAASVQQSDTIKKGNGKRGKTKSGKGVDRENLTQKSTGLSKGDKPNSPENSKTTKNGSMNIQSSSRSIKVHKGLRCLQFPSSLIGSSKEDRFILDVQMYKRNEQLFQTEVSQFMSSQGLKLSSPPVWHNVKVSIFSIFLAVYERGGFELVCEKHQWASVYSEATHQISNKGSSVVKRFYRRNLYPYELYVNDQDYTLAVRALRQILKKSGKSPGSQARCTGSNSSSSCGSSSSLVPDSKDVLLPKVAEQPDFAEHMDTLDEILLILEQEGVDDGDRRVPEQIDSKQPRPSYPWSDKDPRQDQDREDLVDTASAAQIATEPEEKAQVVPELDFPSSIASSERSSQIVDLHELQALHMEVGHLQDEMLHNL